MNIKMQKTYCLFFLLFFSWLTTIAQNRVNNFNTEAAKKIFYTTNDPKEKLEAALIVINRYSGEGGGFDDTAQRLIYAARGLNELNNNDTVNYYLQIWQTEIFYYAGLYQFGIGSAEKQVEYGFKVKDSFLIASAYFFKAINLLELDSFNLVKFNLDKALAFYPKYKPAIAYRKLAYHNQLVNVYAENFFEQKEYDSALYYNSLALQEAYNENSLRGIPAGHLVQGKIFFQLNKYDSATYHFNKTIVLGNLNGHADMVLAAYGKQMLLQKNNRSAVAGFLNKGLALIATEIINNSFKTFFYKDAIAAGNYNNDTKTVQLLQSKLLSIKDSDTKTGNELVQNITTQIVDNENKLLKLEVASFEEQKRLRNFQLLLIALLSALMLLVFLLAYRKNKAKYALLQQKSIIARELHDDVGASVSSIGMYAEVATRRLPPGATALLPLNNISEAVYEVSNNLKDIVWFIQPENEVFARLADRIRQYAEPLCADKDVQFAMEYKHHPKLDALTVTDKKNIYLIIKEAVNNALKYANANKISVKFIIENSKIYITIQDDGIGITQNIQHGNGIPNMQKRANDLKGTIAINASNGVTVSLIIPV
jgi:signal transduction histidine kinase